MCCIFEVNITDHRSSMLSTAHVLFANVLCIISDSYDSRVSVDMKADVRRQGSKRSLDNSAELL